MVVYYVSGLAIIAGIGLLGIVYLMRPAKRK